MTGTSSVIAAAIALALTGCDQVGTSRGTAELQGDLAKTRSRLEKAEADLSSLKQEMAELKRQRDVDDFMKDWDKIAYLTPGAEGYSTVTCDLGVLTVQLTDVKPYANGSKVVLRFGNTLSSSIDGLTSTVEWGRVDEKGVAVNADAKSKEMKFSQTLRAGAWTSVPVVLEGLPPTDLGFVRVSKLSHTGIRLNK